MHAFYPFIFDVYLKNTPTKSYKRFSVIPTSMVQFSKWDSIIIYNGVSSSRLLSFALALCAWFRSLAAILL